MRAALAAATEQVAELKATLAQVRAAATTATMAPLCDVEVHVAAKRRARVAKKASYLPVAGRGYYLASVADGTGVRKEFRRVR